VKLTLQSVAVVVRRDAQGPSILLVRAKESPNAWLFPSSHIGTDESPEDAALRVASKEAGIRGVVLGAIGAPLESKSGPKRALVQHYLIFARSHGRPTGEQAGQWCSFSVALERLPHDDAERLLSVRSYIERWTLPEKRQSDSAPFFQLLLADFEHLGTSLLHNEESGEKRVAFYLTFAGGVGTAVGFLGGTEGPLHDHSRVLVGATLLILLLLGYSTFLRIIIRNAKSDLYKRALSRIRQCFLENIEDPRRHFLPFPPFEYAWRRPSSWKNLGAGGWFETVAVVESVLSGALGVLIVTWLGEQTSLRSTAVHNMASQLGFGFLVGAVTWHRLIAHGNALYTREMTKRRPRVEYEP
jgi:ADP-ribose pyrophosphatase YjhB (NUDIX family)